MDKFIESYFHLQHQIENVIRHRCRLSSSISHARNELSNMTPVYKDFPALVDRCCKLEQIIECDTKKLNRLNSHFKILLERKTAMQKIIYADYIIIPNYRFSYHNRYGDIYIRKDVYYKTLDELKSAKLTEELLIWNINLLTKIMQRDSNYDNKYKYLLLSDVRDLRDLYLAQLKDMQADMSWIKRLQRWILRE